MLPCFAGRTSQCCRWVCVVHRLTPAGALRARLELTMLLLFRSTLAPSRALCLGNKKGAHAKSARKVAHSGTSWTGASLNVLKWPVWRKLAKSCAGGQALSRNTFWGVLLRKMQCFASTMHRLEFKLTLWIRVWSTWPKTFKNTCSLMQDRSC